MGTIYSRKLMHWYFSTTKSSLFFRRYHSHMRRCSSCFHLISAYLLSGAISLWVFRGSISGRLSGCGLTKFDMTGGIPLGTVAKYEEPSDSTESGEWKSMLIEP